MNQTQHWSVLRPILVEAGVDPVRIEDPRAKGVPDISTAIGFIEMKQVKSFPKREGTMVDIGLSENQKRFIKRRAKACESVFISLMVGEQLFLLDGKRVVDVLESDSEEDLTRIWLLTNRLAMGPKGILCWARGMLDAKRGIA